MSSVWLWPLTCGGCFLSTAVMLSRKRTLGWDWVSRHSFLTAQRCFSQAFISLMGEQQQQIGLFRAINTSDWWCLRLQQGLVAATQRTSCVCSCTFNPFTLSENNVDIKQPVLELCEHETSRNINRKSGSCSMENPYLWLKRWSFSGLPEASFVCLCILSCFTACASITMCKWMSLVQRSCSTCSHFSNQSPK